LGKKTSVIMIAIRCGETCRLALFMGHRWDGGIPGV
jgi:hypothetical protein